MHWQKGSKYEEARPKSHQQIQKLYEEDWYVTKKGHKFHDKMQEGQDVLYLRDTRCGCPARIEIILMMCQSWYLLNL